MLDIDKKIVLSDEEGNEVLAEILLTVENDGEKYVFVTNVSNQVDEDEGSLVSVYRYEEDSEGEGQLFEIPEDEEETWKMIEEVFLTFEESNFDVE